MPHQKMRSWALGLNWSGFHGDGQADAWRDSEADCEREGTEGYWRILAQALKVGTISTEWPRSINSWTMSVKMALMKRRPRGSL